MKKEIDKKTSELYIIIEADKNEWKKEFQNAEKNLIKNLSIKGFRKGNVPTDIAKKHISKAEIFSKAIEKIVNVLGPKANQQVDKDHMVLGPATYAVEKIDENNLTIKFIYPIYPEIEIADYKNLGIKYEVKPLQESQVEDELKKIQETRVMLKNKDSEIKKGDVAIFDFEGFIDSKPFDGGKAEKYQLEIGSGQFIPGFEDKMIGLTSGDQKDINVTFPEDYHSDELKGKEAVFKIKIHEVKEKELPKLDDTFAKSIGAKDVNTVDELKDYIKQVFEEQNKQQARTNFQRKAFDKILESTEVPIPSQLLVQEMNRIEEQFRSELKQKGITFDKYLKLIGMDKSKIQSQFKSQAESRLKDAFIFAEIAKKEKIQITDSDYDEEYKKLAKVYNQSVDGVKGLIQKTQMQIPMTNDRVIDKIIEYNK